MNASTRSLRGLDLVNVFMADVKDGVGVYLSVFLLADQGWDPSHIGLVVAIPALVSIPVQSPVGGFIDRTPRKRLLLVAASGVVALSCITVVEFPRFAPIVAAQVALGLALTIFPPCVGAITLGMVGHERLPVRIGRNESFNHAGNLVAAVIASVIGWFISYRGIFYFSIFQCVALVGATLLIRERDIDHRLARAAAEDSAPYGTTRAALRTLLADRDIAVFIAAMCLWNVANGAMLPLLGQKLGLDDVEHSALVLSICIVIAQAVMIVVAPVAARLLDRGRKGLFLVAFLLVPVRAVLFATLTNKYALIGLQLVDGLGAGIYGVLLIVTMADLGKGTGHFNLLQGMTFAAISFGVALSSILSGYVVRHAGYSASFATLAGIGVLATLFFARYFRPRPPPDRLVTGAPHEAAEV